MQRRNDRNQKLIETAEGLDPSTMSLSDMVRFIEQFQASAKDTLAKVENAGELVKEEGSEIDSGEEFETVRLCISVSKRDARLLKEHRAKTGETGSGFVRRMIAEHLQ